jgi:hypothetical protein
VYFALNPHAPSLPLGTDDMLTDDSLNYDLASSNGMTESDSSESESEAEDSAADWDDADVPLPKRKKVLIERCFCQMANLFFRQTLLTMATTLLILTTLQMYNSYTMFVCTSLTF